MDFYTQVYKKYILEYICFYTRVYKIVQKYILEYIDIYTRVYKNMQ